LDALIFSTIRSAAPMRGDGARRMTCAVKHQDQLGPKQEKVTQQPFRKVTNSGMG
jgi:hypothetical protein